MAKELKIGDKVEDGSVLAGIDPTTLKLFFARAADEYDLMTLLEAKQHVLDLNRRLRGTKFRLPTESELGLMFNYKAQIGGFRDTFYLSSSQTNGAVHCRNFNGGNTFMDPLTHNRLAVRLVRN